MRWGVADDYVPCCGLGGTAARSFWTPWPLIQICCGPSLFGDLLVGLSRNLGSGTISAITPDASPRAA